MPKNIINRQFMDDAAVGYRALFRESLASMEMDWNKIAMQTSSNGSEETYGWLGSVPQVKKWLGERAIGKLTNFSYTIRNEKWTTDIGVGMDELEDDKTDIIRPRIVGLAEAAALHYEELIFGLLSDGFTLKAYDGKTFYATDHKDVGSKVAAQSNRTNAVLNADNFRTARAAMLNFKDNQGNPIRTRSTTMVVPPQLESMARSIVIADRDPAGATNVDAGTVGELIVSPFLKTTTEWHLLDTSRAIKPLILQVRTAPEFTALDDLNSDHVYKNDEALYGVKMRDNAGYSLWQLAYGSTGDA